MCLAEGGARDTSLISLAASYEVSHTTGQLLVSLNQVADISGNERTIEPTHVHFTILMQRHRAWKCTVHLTGALVMENFTILAVFEHP